MRPVRSSSPPRWSRRGTATALEPQKPITNYNFISEDGRWKLNLTQGFIALSTLSYTRWEDFATRLDRPLAQFIQLYQPAFFERIGLRYVNGRLPPAFGPGGGTLGRSDPQPVYRHTRRA